MGDCVPWFLGWANVQLFCRGLDHRGPAQGGVLVEEPECLRDEGVVERVYDKSSGA